MDSTGWGTTGGGTTGGGRGHTARWAPGLTIGDYELVEKIGQGGMGAVWKAVHQGSGSVFAVKTITVEADPVALARFEREGQAQAAVDAHPNVVRVRNAGEHMGQRYMVMDLAAGGDLKQRIREHGALPPREAAELIAQLCSGLEHVHARGILHRDLKPPNVLFDAAGVPKLVDFGVARLKGGDRLTQTGTMLGTPSYMAPEQVDGKPEAIDERADVYGIGAVLYECLTAEPPFRGSVHAVIKAVLEDAPIPPREKNADVPADLNAVCLRALAKDPYERYPSARALREDLQRVLRGDKIEGAGGGSRVRLVAGLIVLVGLLAGGALLLAGGGDPSPPTAPTPETLPAATLTVDPLPANPLRSPTLRLTGAASHAARVSAQVGGSLGDVVEAEVQGRTFSLEVPLEPGPQRIKVTAYGPDDAEGEQVKLDDVVYLPIPDWYLALEGPRKPPLPLPEGVEPGESPHTYVHRRTGVELVYVPPARFPMGYGRPIEGVKIPQADVRPIDVEITRGFFLGRYELTVAAYEAFEQATGRPPHRPWASSGYEPEDAGDWGSLVVTPRHPIFGVTWEDAAAYCAWAGFRLPTEAEWNLAAASPAGWQYPWGDGFIRADRESHESTAPMNLTDRMGHNQTIQMYRNDPDSALAHVDAHPDGASVDGALQLMGNVQEWVQDWYAPYPADDPMPLVDPQGPPRGTHKVVRGGDWDNGLGFASTWGRKPQHPQMANEVTGFRVALSAE